MTLRGRDPERETTPPSVTEGAAKAADRIELPATTREDLNKQLLSLIPSLRAFARVLTRNPSEVDDLVQDTLVKAISNIHQFTPGTNLRAWLFTIERNTFYTAHQQRRRQAATPLASCAWSSVATRAQADPGCAMRPSEHLLHPDWK